jgi:nucleoside-diphosphate kinase
MRTARVERTFILLKPDAVQRGLIGEIVHRFERKGMKVVGMKMVHLTTDLATRLYAPHTGEDFFRPLVEFITSSPCVALALEGESVIRRARALVGATHPDESQTGTIRGDFSAHGRKNLIHASDTPEAADRELRLLFTEQELADYRRWDASWLGVAG